MNSLKNLAAVLSRLHVPKTAPSLVREISASATITAGVSTLMFSCLISQPPTIFPFTGLFAWIFLVLIKTSFVFGCCSFTWLILGKVLQHPPTHNTTPSARQEKYGENSEQYTLKRKTQLSHEIDEPTDKRGTTIAGDDTSNHLSFDTDEPQISASSDSDSPATPAEMKKSLKIGSSKDATEPESDLESPDITVAEAAAGSSISRQSLMLPRVKQRMRLDQLRDGQTVCFWVNGSQRYICVHKDKETIKHRYPVLGTQVGYKITLDKINEQDICLEDYTHFCFNLVFESQFARTSKIHSMATNTMLCLMGKEFFNTGSALVAWRPDEIRSDESGVVQIGPQDKFDLEEVEEVRGVFTIKTGEKYILWDEKKQLFSHTYKRDEAAKICIELSAKLQSH